MFLKHPAWAWLKKHNKKILPETPPELQRRFDEGNLFETYAEQLFPDGVRLGFSNYNEYLSLPERTLQELQNGTGTIFQGRFEADNLTCIIDVLQRVEGDTYDLFEIKASTKAKEEHFHDLAFQTIVLEGSGLSIRNIAVVHVNNEYVRDGEIDIKELTGVSDITEEVREKIEVTKENIEKALKTIALPSMPDPSPKHVRLSAFKEWMEIYSILNGAPAAHSIYSLPLINAKRVALFEELGVLDIKDIPENFELTDPQQRYVDAVQADEVSIDTDAIKDFVENLEYPLHFLDYETFSSIIPPFDGLKPYQQVPFQYSLHIQNEPGGELIHKEYLHTENSNPIPSLLENLKNDMEGKGSVLVWYEVFEKGRNKEMAEFVPEYKDFLEDVNERVVDLMLPFKKGEYVHKDFFGSASIKNVLPVLVPELSYKELDIQNGEMALRLWTEAALEGKHSDEVKEKIMSDLIKYCELDTLAMVKILEVLEKVD